jgi:hypothetical protein
VFLLSHLLKILWSNEVGVFLAIAPNEYLGVSSVARGASWKSQRGFTFLELDEGLVSTIGSGLKKTFSLIKTNCIILDVVKEGGKVGPKARQVNFSEASKWEIDMERIFLGVIVALVK